MPEELLDAINAEECDTEAWEVSMPHPLEKWHRALEEGRVLHASRKLATADKQQFIKAKLRSRVMVYDRRTESLRLEAPPAREKESSQDLEHEFRRLAEQWRSETMFISLDRERACSFAYQQIIGMGKDALPFIFRELKETTSDWFWALRAITRTDVEVRPEDKGNVHKIAEAWMDWGRQNRYVA